MSIVPDEVIEFLNRQSAGLCPLCGSPLCRVYDFGSEFEECSNDGVFGCYFVRRVR